jgi:hypothetical protein
LVAYYDPDIITAQDYYPFEMLVQRLTLVATATTTVTMSGMPTGVYIVEVYNYDKIVSIKKIIKQ